jgi:hypothetical protein
MGVVWVRDVTGHLLRADRIERIWVTAGDLTVQVIGEGQDRKVAATHAGGDTPRQRVSPELGERLALLIGRYAAAEGGHVLTAAHVPGTGWNWDVTSDSETY